MANYRFNGTPLVQYNDTLITDISHNIDISWTNGLTYFVDYVIQDGDTPENLAYRMWQDSSLSWIILYVNGIVDPFFEWPMLPDELMKYVENKYGRREIYSPHHYVKGKYVVNKDPNDPSITMVTNYEYESNRNEDRRKIRIPTEEFMQDFIDQWGKLNG